MCIGYHTIDRMTVSLPVVGGHRNLWLLNPTAMQAFVNLNFKSTLSLSFGVRMAYNHN